VDNASSEEGLEKILSEYENLVLIKNEKNLGFAAANNQGVKIAKGEYILLLNNDTIFTSDIITPLLSELKNLPNSLVAPKLLYADGTFQNSAYKFPTLLRIFYSSFFIERLFSSFNYFNKFYVGIEKQKTKQKVDAVIGAFMLMRKITFENLGGFDERFFFYHEDTDFCYRLHKANGAVYYFSQYELIHIGGGTTNDMPWFQLKNKVIARMKFFRFNKSYPEYLLFSFIEKTGNLIRSVIYFISGLFTFNKEKFALSKNYLRTLKLNWKSR
jgi:GT2 family glycosyltransferase